jgi:hydroxymethylbilane synthase
VNPTPWRVATRRSSLARAQAGAVAEALAAATGRPAELVAVSTTGDERPDRAVEAFDAKGLFVDGVRRAVLDGRAHCAVHSYKDLPTERRRGLLVGAVPRREDPRDLLVTRDGARLSTLPSSATVGTSSARRKAQLQRARRDVLVQPLRGNLDTRLRRVAAGELDAVVVALAGVKRSGPVDLPLQAVPLEHGECLHAPAQGALAVECRDDDAETLAALDRVDDRETRTLVRAERARSAGCRAGAPPRSGRTPPSSPHPVGPGRRGGWSCWACCPTRPGPTSTAPATRPPPPSRSCSAGRSPTPCSTGVGGRSSSG